MKKIIASLILSLILVITVVVAQEELTTKEELSTPVLLPDNPFYPVQTFFEQVRLWVTFNNEARARLRLYYADLRLAEMNEMIKRNELQHAERLKVRYENEIDKVENELNVSKGLGQNVTALTEHVCNMTYKHVFVLERVFEKAPNASRPVIERVINASIVRHENCVARIQEIVNRTIEKVKRFNCTVDTDCEHLFCPMVIGNDTIICKEGRCACGAKWEITNETEWRERFGKELTTETREAIQRIKEAHTASKGK